MSSHSLEDAAAAKRSNRPRLLVIDDEPGNLLTFKRVLRQVYDITLASSGAEALALFATGETPFDVMIVDYAMPIMNGAQLLLKVRQQHPGLPCIFLTAHAELPEVQAAGRENGVVAIILKPWERADIERWVEQSLRIASMKRSIVGMRT